MKTVQLIAKWFLLVFILSAGTAVAQPQLIEKVEQGSGMTIPFEKWKLANGLTILVHEDHTNPLVTVRITYHVGSCLLYTSDAADERSSVDLGGRRFIKKKNIIKRDRRNK